MRRNLLRFLGIAFASLAAWRWFSGRDLEAIALATAGLVLFTAAGAGAGAAPRSSSPIELDDAQLSEVLGLLDRHRKIEAIRRVREMSGTGLRAAKDYVDALEGS